MNLNPFDEGEEEVLFDADWRELEPPTRKPVVLKKLQKTTAKQKKQTRSRFNHQQTLGKRPNLFGNQGG